MIITRTKKAIIFYELAIKNAQRTLEFDIDQDEEYQAFKEKYKKLGYTTIFYKHTQEFAFYIWDIEKTDTEDYFRIEDCEIIYDENNTFEGVEDIANELLEIVKKFY